ncbi:MAG: AzlC family ABC transporter permease [Anaerolineales bacterium]|nr:AzlC family ABC transporter permease [Anaerolineales bacterium]
MTSRFRQFTLGIQAELPILIGVVPFGMIYGVLALAAGIPPAAAQAMSAIVFAGSAQIVLTQLVSAATPALVMILTVFVVNLRHALYSASMAPHLQRLNPFFKLLLAYLLTDEAYAVTILHYEKVPAPGADSLDDDRRQWFFLGAGLALWSSWQLSTAAGIFLGAIVPASWELDFTLALTFIALVVPNLNDRAAQTAAAMAGLVALLAFHLPYKLGLIAAALLGVGIGLLVERKALTQ